MAANEHSAEVVIANPMGFHVRPVQRFAELARVFQSELTVKVRGREVPGKSVINLVSLGGRSGDRMTITASGADARQCVDILRYLAESRFFVEDNVQEELRPDRHVERLNRMASVFESDVRVELDGAAADAKSPEQLAALGLTPTSMPKFDIHGPDAAQARAVLDNLVASCYYVEDTMAERGRKVS